MVVRIVLVLLSAMILGGMFRHADETPAGPSDAGTVAPRGDVQQAAVAAAAAEVPLPLRATDDGFEVVSQSRPAAGPGVPVPYTVEVESSLRDQSTALQERVEAALDDTRHGWAAQVGLKQVAEPTQARIRILLAQPATVDRLCAEAGYYTAGQFSCWNGRFAALNVMRWRQAAEGFESVDQYRLYQINHEFGHGLGRMHEYCAAQGALAPVMMQQTKGLLGCRPNPFPFP